MVEALAWGLPVAETILALGIVLIESRRTAEAGVLRGTEASG
jgi:hypothetical protein